MRPNSRGAIALAVAAVLAVAPGALAKKRVVVPATAKSQSIELPAGDDVFPDRRGAEAADRNCLSCHSTEMVMNQPALPRDVWAAEVEKMRTAYKAPIDPDDVQAIVDYLSSTRGENRRSWR